MAVKDVLRKLLGYKLGGGGFTEMAIPPGWNYQGYLEAYGNIGWLFGAVSLIASSVASSEWVLYKELAKGEQEEIDDHPLIDLWNHVNPFQTRYQFLLMLETYIELVGEAFIVLNFNRLKLPAEMWLAPPGNMSIIPSAEKYISHYEFTRGGNKLRLEVPEVIHILNPNPANPYRGTGAARSIATDLDSEFYAGKYQNKLFYNDATPRLFLEFPDLPPVEERKRLRDEFSDMHQGWRNAYKPGFLWGGAKANTVSLSAKDMDFAALRNASKKLILGAYHIPESLIGAADVGSRARAEADEYLFAKYTIKPALQRIREALNEQLCPLFDETLEWDFENPVPEDIDRTRLNIREDVKASIITREEARLMIGLDAEAEGTFLIPFSTMEVPAKELPQKYLSKAWGEEQKDAHWKVYISKTEGEEKSFITRLKKLWDKQEKEVIHNLKGAEEANDALFDVNKAQEEFDEALKPLIGQVFNHHYEDAQNLVSPENPHVDSKDWNLLNEFALEWIRSRSLELAELINGTSIEDLRRVLAEGFELGESIPDLTKRVTEYYGEAEKVRARMVARTETIAASNEGALQGYGELGVEKTEWYTAPDERRCEECAAQHGVQYALSESHGLIPAHPNCLLPDVRVEASHIISASRAFYKGKAIEITTENGHKLTITPNHMVLTLAGFIKAQSLSEGGYIIGCLDSQRIISSIDPYHDHTPTSVKDIWDSLVMQKGMLFSSVPVAAEDFHGDAGGFEGNVDIIHPNGFLWDEGNILGLKHISEYPLNSRYSRLAQLSSSSSRFSLNNGGITPSNGSMGSSGSCLALCGGHECHRNGVGLATIAGRNPSINESATDESPAYTKLARKFQLRFSSLITPEQINKIRYVNYVGHVYDLQSLEQLYIGNGIVVKNCRCVWVPVV